ncbi:hypothetical protein HPB52_012397 [Rhipicephalus sanguineus]|uniref:XPG N-terminal domain-containing protein n=1 Tax=Rhipicephalus sanguineus TaxID=34632 RepID=A0A9D4T9V2_RHISA|nr:hypothetical protein HPB52_012397 [Rhipicephalus sanguineus]
MPEELRRSCGLNCGVKFATFSSASGSSQSLNHLVGFFYRTIRMIENGIKPVYVFDGKPPGMKSSELEKRQERREAAEKELEKAEEAVVHAVLTELYIGALL